MSSTGRPFDRVARLAAFALLTALPACSRHHAGETGVGNNEPAVITFTNESLSQADVFAIAPGSSARRIGTVMAGRSETMTIPADVALRGSLRLVARVLASSHAPGSGTITFSPGEHLSVRLPLDELPGS
jgi:hypothetical protein